MATDRELQSSATDLAEDWTTIWQSELAARGTDPETGQLVHAVLEAWLRGAGMGAGGTADDRTHAARPDAPAWPAATWPAPSSGANVRADGGGDMAELRRRLDALERHLADPKPG